MNVSRIVITAVLVLAPLAAAASGCELAAATGAGSSQACLACHDGGTHSHPVDLDYPMAWARDPRGLRPAEEVVLRGVSLPDGRLECGACHDARSPWENHLALPPGAPVLPAVVARRPATSEERPNWRLAKAEDLPPLAPGSAVSPAPLCAACHTTAD